MKKVHYIATIVGLAALLLAGSATAQESEIDEEAGGATASSAERGPDDALGRGNPRSSIIGYLTAAADLQWEKAAEYLDLRNLPPEVKEIGGPELARQLNHVLSRTVWFDDYSVSDNPEGLKGDGLPQYRDLLLNIRTAEGDVPVWMQRVPRGDGEKIWKVSNRSVALIPELYAEFSYPPVVESIRQWFPLDASFLGVEAFKWFILVLLALLSWPVLYVVGWLLSRLFSSPERDIYPLVRRVFTGPLLLIGILVIIGFALRRLGAGAYAQQIMSARTLSIIALVWAAVAIIDLYKKYKQNKLITNDRPGAAKLLQPMTTLLKLLVIMFGLLFWLNNIGVNITTLLAGLGVGGLAVALALQKPLEDMMGALTIFSQAPVRVGDLCRYGTIVGIVEDIGLRTTRLRTLTNTVVSIPNSKMAYVEVENLSYREKIRYGPTLRLRYDTSQQQLQEIRDRIWELLGSHERIYDEPIRVRFTDFDKDAILVKVHCFMKTTNFDESLAIGEELNMKVMSIVEEVGARFALPGTTMYVEGDKSAFPA
jgi:MscS family membrane protein